MDPVEIVNAVVLVGVCLLGFAQAHRINLLQELMQTQAEEVLKLRAKLANPLEVRTVNKVVINGPDAERVASSIDALDADYRVIN